MANLGQQIKIKKNGEIRQIWSIDLPKFEAQGWKIEGVRPPPVPGQQPTLPKEQNPSSNPSTDDEEAEKEALKKALDEKGIKYHHNNSIETLREKLEAANT